MSIFYKFGVESADPAAILCDRKGNIITSVQDTSGIYNYTNNLYISGTGTGRYYIYSVFSHILFFFLILFVSSIRWLRCFVTSNINEFSIFVTPLTKFVIRYFCQRIGSYRYCSFDNFIDFFHTK